MSRPVAAWEVWVCAVVCAVVSAVFVYAVAISDLRLTIASAVVALAAAAVVVLAAVGRRMSR